MKRTDFYINTLNDIFSRNGRSFTLYSVSFLSGVVLLVSLMLIGSFLFDAK